MGRDTRHAEAPDAESDDALVVRMQRGDRGAFDEIVRRHGPGLRHFFESRSYSVKARQSADDLTHDVFVKVMKSIKKYVPRGQFKSWLYRLARNHLTDTGRREGYDALLGARADGGQEMQLDEAECREQSVPDQASRRILLDVVTRLLKRIPEDQRNTFLLHHFIGLRVEEISDVLDVPPATTKSRLRLVREKLREGLANRGITAE